MRLIRLLVLLLQVSVNSFAQGKLSQWRKLSRPEKIWVLTHPFIAKKAFKLTQKAIASTAELKQLKGLGGENGGQLDAFRHSYWMALLTQRIGSRKAYRLGLAHEKGNKLMFRKHLLEEGAMPDSVSSAMDMANNQVGIDVGKKYDKSKLDVELRAWLISKILQGEMKIICMNSSGTFIDCSGKPIDMALWQGKWNIPKCLCSSNSIP